MLGSWLATKGWTLPDIPGLSRDHKVVFENGEPIGVEASANPIQPPPLVPPTITRLQGRMQLLKMGLMTAAEAKADAVPSFISDIVDQMPDDEGAELILRWRESEVWHRNDPLFAGSLLTAAAAVLER